MISYLKKLLKQNDSVKIHLIDGSVVSALHFKKGYSKAYDHKAKRIEENFSWSYMVYMQCLTFSLPYICIYLYI